MKKFLVTGVSRNDRRNGCKGIQFWGVRRVGFGNPPVSAFGKGGTEGKGILKRLLGFWGGFYFELGGFGHFNELGHGLREFFPAFFGRCF